MGEMDKTKEKLTQELAQAQKRIAELEATIDSKGKTPKLDSAVFENFVESATDSFTIWDSNLNLIYINNATLKYHPAGTKKSDVIGKNIKELIPNAEKSGHYERYKHVLETGEPLIIEDFKADPKYGDTYLSIKVFKINDGIGIISSDITERKRMEQALTESQQRSRALIDNAPDVIFTYDINGRFISGNKKAEELLGYSKEEILGKTFAESGMFTPESLTKTTPRLENYKQGKATELMPYELIAKDGSHIFVEVRGVPIVHGEKIEVIAIARDITERKRIEKELNDYKENLERMVEERTSELASTNEELRESEERLRAFFENVPDILFGHDMTGKFTAVNKKALEISGYSRNEIIGKNILETGILPADQIEGVIEGLKGIEEGKSGYPYEVQLAKKNGDRIIVEAVSFPIKRKDVLEVMGIARDITERKRMENALKNSEEKLRTMFASLADGVVVTDLEGIFKDANEALLRMFGYSKKEDVLGMNGFDFIAEKDRDLAMNDMAQLFSEGLVTGRSWTFKHRSGGEFEAELSTALLKDAKGNPTDILVVMRDISERKQIEEALRESEQKLRLMFEAINEGIFVIDLDGKVTEVNRGVEEITGYRREQLLGQSGLDYMFPGFKDDAMGMLQKVIAQGGTQKEVVVPMKTATGKVIEVEAISSVLRDISGNPIGLIGIVRDISERKKAEDKLKESKEELRFYLNQITKAQEEERKKIARELHDDTIQELITLSRQLDDLIDKKIGPDEDRRGSRKKIEGAQQKVTLILQSVRRFTRDLRPSVLDDLGLVPALEWLTSDMSAQFKIPIDISIIGTGKKIAPDAALAMFRVAQESLRNAGSHSKASQIQLNLKYTSKTVTLSIIDNGKGFTPPKQISSLTRHGKLGVAGMYERAQLIGATLSIKSRRNKGTIITLEVPIK